MLYMIDTLVETPIHQLPEHFLREDSRHDRSSRQQIDPAPILLQFDRDAIFGPDGIMLGLPESNISDLDLHAIGQREHRHLFPCSIGDLQMNPDSCFTSLM